MVHPLITNPENKSLFIKEENKEHFSVLEFKDDF